MSNILGLIANDNSVPFQKLVSLAHALQEQVAQLRAVWPATDNYVIKAFQGYDDFEPGAWPVVFASGISPGGGGSHFMRNGRPGAYVEADEYWTIVGSHECLEIMADPFGDRRIRGFAPLNNTTLNMERDVDYLAEISDPCVSPSLAYAIGAIWVSDFVTPEYYKPPVTGARYSYTGQITEPCSVGPFGYVSYEERGTDVWFQWKAAATGGATEIRLGALDLSTMSARTAIYRIYSARDFSGLDPADLKRMNDQSERMLLHRNKCGNRLEKEVRAHLKNPPTRRVKRLKSIC